MTMLITAKKKFRLVINGNAMVFYEGMSEDDSQILVWSWKALSLIVNRTCISHRTTFLVFRSLASLEFQGRNWFYWSLQNPVSMFPSLLADCFSFGEFC